jgi:uncharacterized protein
MKRIHWMVVLMSAAVPLCAEVPYKVVPMFHRPAGLRAELRGVVGERLRANLENWELRAPDANPAMLEMFADRERKPGRNLLPWSGEFVGKYLCSSILSYRLLGDPRQRALIQRVAHELMANQGPDGYLGPFDANNRLTGRNWDIWGHYWAIRALLLYREEFGDQEALRVARRAADLLVDKFLDKGIALTNDGSFGQMNYAVIHAFTALYRATGEARYLAMARWITRQWDRPGAGLYLRFALAGREMYEFPGNRWESLHDFQGLHEIYLLTGEPGFGQAARHIWNSILKGDRHNTGGFTSGERTTGNPYDTGAIETCCTIAWIDWTIDMLRLEGDSRIADELELSTFNGMMGGQHPSGRWWTYDTPMDGTKKASAHSIVFQARAGSPELNCCSVNGPRGLGLIGEWALLGSEKGLVLNYYGPSTLRATTPGGQLSAIEQKTQYPKDGDVKIGLLLARPEKFELRLRIPSWSANTRVAVNGATVAAKAGTYLLLDREWSSGDRIEVALDLSFHFWAGEREQDAKTSVYRGPLLLAFDTLHNEADIERVPELDGARLEGVAETSSRMYKPWVLLKFAGAGGQSVRLCDFATAGAYGTNYKTWLPVRNVKPVPYGRRGPVWVNRPANSQ